MDAYRYGCQKVFSQRASDIQWATLPLPNDSPWGAPDDITEKARLTSPAFSEWSGNGPLRYGVQLLENNLLKIHQYQSVFLSNTTSSNHCRLFKHSTICPILHSIYSKLLRKVFASREFETPPVKQSEVLDSSEEDEEFAPFRFLSEVTGFSQEDDDNHRAYRMELYFKPSLDVIPEEEELEEPSKQKCSRRWKIKFRTMFKKLHLLCCFNKR
ncbi:hypothetical protein TNCV_998201 [Trichonephila clavipes]|nr:hypothetical protein TNCV_998201 [Trichonephila clavipes]